MIQSPKAMSEAKWLMKWQEMKLDTEKLSKDFLRDTLAYKKNIYELTLNPICAIILVGKEKIISLKTPPSCFQYRRR